MKSMFWKLFFSLLLAIFIGGGLSVLAISTFGFFSPALMPRDQIIAMDQKLAETIAAAGTSADQIYRFGGEGEYLKFIGALQAGAGIEVFLVSPDGLKIGGGMLNDQQQELLRDARKAQHTILRKSRELLSVGKSLQPNRSDGLVMIGEKHFAFNPPGWPGGKEPPPFGGPVPKPPFEMARKLIQAVIMLSVIAGVCYFIARSLALPLQKLQHTARKIAKGDYSARVGIQRGAVGSEINDLAREFDIMAERTEKAIHAQNRLLRDISHELRSPLARLNVALEILRPHCAAEGENSLNQIGREAERLNDLIGQLIILSRLDCCNQFPLTSTVNLTELIEEIADDVHYEASINDRSVKIVSSVAVEVRGSRELLRRAFENIIRNGARFTAPHSCVEIALRRQEDTAIVRVVDNGPGIPEKELDNVFEPFYRVDEARERESGGVGIGLTISRQALLAHGGKIILKNRNDASGCEATILIPVGRL